MKILKKNLNYKRGFTLIEFIVAIGLFVVAIYMGFGAIISLFDSNNKSQTIFSSIGNLNYSIESLTRDIRFADVYHCGSAGTLSSPADCSGGETSLAVTTGGVTTVYRFSGTQIEKSINGGVYTPVTGGDITLSYARFYVVGSAPASAAVGTPGRDLQPYVVLVLKGNSGNKSSSQTDFDIETLVSQKKLDL
jgi:prepilin-type N-terminal cleavage/methylation domain-containing protein